MVDEKRRRNAVRWFCMAIAAIGLLVFGGCASCGTCQGAEIESMNDDGDVPPPPPTGPRKGRTWHVPARVAEPDEFATAADDEPEPDLADPPVTTTRAKKRHKARKGVYVEQSGDGTINIGSSGVAPANPAVPGAYPVPGRAGDGFATPPVVAVGPTATPIGVTPIMTGPGALPLIPGPLTDAQYVGLFKRATGAGYYFLTGKCPTLKPKAAPAVATAAYPMMAAYPALAAAPAMTAAYATVPVTSYATMPVTSYQTVPVTSYATVPVATPAAAPMFAQPQYYAAPAPAAAPQYFPQAAPPAKATPQASPQGPIATSKILGLFHR